MVRAGDRRPRLPVGLGRHLRLPAGGDEAALGAGDRPLRDGPRAAPRRELPIDDRPRGVPARRRPGSRPAATSSGWPPPPDWGEVHRSPPTCASSRSSATLIRRELGTRAAAASGDTVTPVLARAATQEWEWARAWTVALCRFLLADDDARRRTTARRSTGWVRATGGPRRMAAAAALAPSARPSAATPARAEDAAQPASSPAGAGAAECASRPADGGRRRTPPRAVRPPRGRPHAPPAPARSRRSAPTDATGGLRLRRHRHGQERRGRRGRRAPRPAATASR